MGSNEVDGLIESGVFEPATGETELKTTEEFDAAVAEHERTLEASDPKGIREAVTELTDEEGAAEALCAGAEYDSKFLARYVAIGERGEDLTPGQALALAVVVDQLESGSPPSEGSPEAFLPVGGENLVRLVETYERCVVYAWRDDCPSCDVMRADFDDLVGDTPPEDVIMLSVYGPECARLLEEEYDVVIAPTTLFTLEGQVDARLIGAPERVAIENELETIRERTLPSA